MRTPLHNVGSWPRCWALRAPGRLAITDAEHRLDWARFEQRIARLAGWLGAAGVGPGDRVAMLLGNRVATLELLFASARLGAVCLPINTRLAPREIAWLLDDCSPTALFHETVLAATTDSACRAAQHPPALRVEVGPGSDRYEKEILSAPARVDIHPVCAEDPMLLMYTSGTTGTPKGALLPHRKALYNSLNAQLFFGIRHEDRVLVAAPLFHSLGLQILSLPLLYSGGSLFLHEHFDPERVWRAVEDDGIRYFGGVPTMHQRLHEVLRSAPRGRHQLGGLRFVFTAGSAVPVDLIHAFESQGLVLKQGYGQTETSILCCLDAQDAVRKAGSVGLPVFHVELRVVSLDTLAGPVSGWRDVAVGEVGEIVARGPITMLGYWNRPEATAEILREGWVCTRDLARVDAEGFVSLAGRSRDMFISGGENVYPAEIEATFLEHPAVREIAVVGVADERWGEVGRAHVVLEPGQSLDAEALRAWAGERLAKFKIPRSFVHERDLPRTATGKVRKHELLRNDGQPALE